MSSARKSLFTALCLVPVACSVGMASDDPVVMEAAVTACTIPIAGVVITIDTTLCAGTFTLDTPAGTAALTIGADNVTVTCNGTVLNGPGPSGATASPNVGFSIAGRRGVTLKGCTAKGFQYGAVVKNSSSVTLDSVHFDDNFTDAAAGWVYDSVQGGGVRFENAASSTLKNSTLSRNWNAVELRGSSGITVTGNAASHSSNIGALLLASNNNTISNNDFSYAIRGDTSFGAITFDAEAILLDNGSSGNLIQGNNARYGGDGIFLRGLLGPCGTNNRIIGNDASYSPNNAIESWCDNNVFSGNTASHSNYGLWLGASDNSIVIGNTANNNNTDGISIQCGSDRHTLIQDNALQGNGRAGLFLAGANYQASNPPSLQDVGTWNSSHILVQRNSFNGNGSFDVFGAWTHGVVLASNFLAPSQVVLEPSNTAFFNTLGSYSGARGRTPPTALLANPGMASMNIGKVFDASASKLSSSGGALTFHWLVQLAGETYLPGQLPPVVLGGVAGPKPTVTFTRPGTYDVDVFATDGFLGALASRSITVLPTGTRVGETAAAWTYACADPNDNCSTTKFVDEAGGQEGTAVHLTTGALFDFSAITPTARNLGLNASALHYLGFFVKAKNVNDGAWQPPNQGLPVVVLGGPAGTLRYEPSTVLLPTDGTTWAYVEVPLAPVTGSGWALTDNGGSLANIDWLEIHADTWGCVFVFWFHPVRFFLFGVLAPGGRRSPATPSELRLRAKLLTPPACSWLAWLQEAPFPCSLQRKCFPKRDFLSVL